MKRILIFMIFAVLILTSCSKKTPLQEATGMPNEQATFIENILAEHDITYTNVAISSNPITNGMDESWQAYDLTAVLDNEGRVIEGLIDNGVTPALFD